MGGRRPGTAAGGSGLGAARRGRGHVRSWTTTPTHGASPIESSESSISALIWSSIDATRESSIATCIVGWGGMSTHREEQNHLEGEGEGATRRESSMEHRHTPASTCPWPPRRARGGRARRAPPRARPSPPSPWRPASRSSCRWPPPGRRSARARAGRGYKHLHGRASAPKGG